MRGAIPPLPQYAFMVWYSKKAQGNFTFTFAFKRYHALQTMREWMYNILNLGARWR
jgi:hypothetical protein